MEDVCSQEEVLAFHSSGLKSDVCLRLLLGEYVARQPALL